MSNPTYMSQNMLTSKSNKTWHIVEGSQQPIPKWILNRGGKKEIGGKLRQWGRLILNYPLEYIIPAHETGNNPRSNADENHHHLDKLIDTLGFVGTLTVTPIGKDRKTGNVVYEILSGDRRFYSLKKNGIKTVNIQVYEGTEEELAPLRIALNGDTEMHPADESIYIENVLHKKFGYTYEEIAASCSTSSKAYGKSWAATTCTIAANCIPEVLQAWRRNAIKKTHALRIARKFNQTQVAEQMAALEISLSGVRVNDLPNIISNMSIGTHGSTILQPVRQRKNKEKHKLIPVKRKKKLSKTKRQKIRYKLRTLFELRRRYKAVDEDSFLKQEYEWILGLSDEPPK